MPEEEHYLFRDHFLDILCVDTRRLGTGKWKQYKPCPLLKSSHYGGDRHKQRISCYRRKVVSVVKG